MADYFGVAHAFWPYLLIIAVGFLPSEVWRVLGVFLSRNINEQSEILVWVRAVAVTLLAGVVAKFLFAPSGALGAVPSMVRWGSLLAGLAGYFLLRRSVIAGVVLGEITLITFAWLGAP